MEFGIDVQIDDIVVDTIPTPNPDALMFQVQERLVPSGTYEYLESSQADGAPLARNLFVLPGVRHVLVASRFVTVTKEENQAWPSMVPAIKQTVREFLASGDVAVVDLREDAAPTGASEVETRIIQVLDEQVRPAVAQDGGDISFVGFQDGIVQLRLIGSCGSCPSAVTTLKMGVEVLLMEEVPEVQGVEQV
ncbi:MAG: NifU family protein [Myxococcota bacterium]|jgi:Fe-S cluster biogenesis protein NfuA|nr:NifU family protein [Myxococcota bacterium]